MEQAIHVVLNCLRACKHPWNHTKIRGGKQMKGLSWAIHWCCGISAPVPSGRNSCPPNKKAEKHQLCCHHTWQPKHEQRQEEYARPWCMASVFLEIFWSISLWFLAPQCCPVHWCSMPWWREHVRDPHMGTQSCCPPEAPCSLPPAQHSGPQGSSSLLRCRGPKRWPSKVPFSCIWCPFSRCSLETANQWTDFGPKTGVIGVRKMALPRRDAVLAQSWTSTLCKTLLMQDEGQSWSTPSSSWTALWWSTWNR